MLEKKGTKFRIVKTIGKKISRRQDAPKCFDLTTVCYVFKPEYILKTKNLLSGKVGFVEIPKERAIDIDDKIDYFHYYTTLIKFGIGRATYDSSQEIRNKEITKEEGLNLVKKYDGEYPARFEKEIFEYLTISQDDYGDISKLFEKNKMDRNYFNSLCDQFRSPHIWYKENNKWKIRK